MERSSPLAAMHPHAPDMGHGSWNFGKMGPPTMSSSGSMTFGSGSFDFNDLSMRQSGNDYFTLRPNQGVSPTANLAVDLSRNFHIDRSPQPPTPRRSLFAANLFEAINCKQNAVTPPPPSSPACPATDMMEISPLPHKAPHAATIQVHSPTPEPSPNPQSMLSSPSVIPESPVERLKPQPPAERKRPAGGRPSLSRLKGLTTTALCTKSNIDIPPQPFKFGHVNALQPPAQLSLEECFTDSPEEMSFPNNPVTQPMGPPRPKSAYQKSNLGMQTSGSPNVRKAPSGGAPCQRPRKQFRRSLSMFEHPADVHNQQKQDARPPACSLSAIADSEDAQPLALPHFFPDQDTMPRITQETMVDVLDGKYQQHYDRLMVVDCRFEYEYTGGHIAGAVNFTNKEELAAQLVGPAAAGASAAPAAPPPPRTLLVFHCEYSAHRAPLAARHLRAEDRAANAHRYPRLSFPDTYVLAGGYSAFFAQHKARCHPQSYVEMNDAKHAAACERGLGRMRQARGKLARAQTFAFGQHGQEASPTGRPNAAFGMGAAAAGAAGGKCADLLMAMDISPVRPGAGLQAPTRRMCSF